MLRCLKRVSNASIGVKMMSSASKVKKPFDKILVANRGEVNDDKKLPWISSPRIVLTFDKTLFHPISVI